MPAYSGAPRAAHGREKSTFATIATLTEAVALNILLITLRHINESAQFTSSYFQTKAEQISQGKRTPRSNLQNDYFISFFRFRGSLKRAVIVSYIFIFPYKILLLKIFYKPKRHNKIYI